jgi:hypothetical protein
LSKQDGSSIISLPKGGGAQKGIGEKFSPDLHTGTGNFTVPIALPPGRNGFQPQLNVLYNTGNGNGVFGLGWNLSIPGVSRKTSHGIPRYRDYDPELKNRDTFILSGAVDLYRSIHRSLLSRGEGSFSTARELRDSSPRSRIIMRLTNLSQPTIGKCAAKTASSVGMVLTCRPALPLVWISVSVAGVEALTER